MCSGNGMCVSGTCMCSPRFSGLFCQTEGQYHNQFLLALVDSYPLVCHPIYAFFHVSLLLPSDDCATDEDCNGGVCIDLMSTATVPRRQCFCNPGSMGIHCEQRKLTHTNKHTQKHTYMYSVHTYLHAHIYSDFVFKSAVTKLGLVV